MEDPVIVNFDILLNQLIDLIEKKQTTDITFYLGSILWSLNWEKFSSISVCNSSTNLCDFMVNEGLEIVLKSSSSSISLKMHAAKFLLTSISPANEKSYSILQSILRLLLNSNHHLPLIMAILSQLSDLSSKSNDFLALIIPAILAFVARISSNNRANLRDRSLSYALKLQLGYIAELPAAIPYQSLISQTFKDGFSGHGIQNEVANVVHDHEVDEENNQVASDILLIENVIISTLDCLLATSVNTLKMTTMAYLWLPSIDSTSAKGGDNDQAQYQKHIIKKRTSFAKELYTSEIEIESIKNSVEYESLLEDKRKKTEELQQQQENNGLFKASVNVAIERLLNRTLRTLVQHIIPVRNVFSSKNHSNSSEDRIAIDLDNPVFKNALDLLPYSFFQIIAFLTLTLDCELGFFTSTEDGVFSFIEDCSLFQALINWASKRRNITISIECLRLLWFFINQKLSEKQQYVDLVSTYSVYINVLEKLIDNFSFDTKLLTLLLISAPCLPISTEQESSDEPFSQLASTLSSHTHILHHMILIRPSYRISLLNLFFKNANLTKSCIVSSTELIADLYDKCIDVRKNIIHLVKSHIDIKKSESLDLLILLCSRHPSLIVRVLFPILLSIKEDTDSMKACQDRVNALLPAMMAEYMISSTNKQPVLRLIRLLKWLSIGERKAQYSEFNSLFVSILTAVQTRTKSIDLSKQIFELLVADYLDIHLLACIDFKRLASESEDKQYISKNELQEIILDKLLPRLLFLLDPSVTDYLNCPDANYILVKEQLNVFPIDPVQLFIQIHLIEHIIGLRRSIVALQILFQKTKQFNPELLANALQIILEKHLIPNLLSQNHEQGENQPSLLLLYIRTILQSVTLHKQLVGFASGLISRLLLKVPFITTSQAFKKSWEGLIRCFKQMMPSSLGIIQQLPKQIQHKLIDENQDLTMLIREYLWNQPPSVRSRYSTLVEYIASKHQ